MNPAYYTMCFPYSHSVFESHSLHSVLETRTLVYSTCTYALHFSLSNLFNGFNEGSALRLPVYTSMARFAGQTNLLHLVPADFKQVRMT